MTDSFGAAFGRLIKRKRAELKMTQAQLACALYPNLETHAAEARKGDISKLENGKVPNPTTQTIKRLSDALGITVDELDALQRRLQMSPGDQLEDVSVLDRDQLELLAGRFEIEKPYALTDAALRDMLTKKAEEYRALKSEVDSIEDGLLRLSNLKAAAQGAIARVDLEEVEELLSRVQEVELEEAAKTAELRANNALLRGNVEQAYQLYRSTANSFEAVQPDERVTRILYQYCSKLYYHALRYGGQGSAYAHELVTPVVIELKDHANPKWEADSLIWKGLALQDQGTRTDGAEGTRLLAEAARAYTQALTIYTKADHPVDWAMTQNNLGAALQDQGTRTDGAESTRLLAEAVDAYTQALTIYTKADHPVDWAMTQNNLGTALSDQGIRTDGAESTRLLAEAVDAYTQALTIYTKADHPVNWAKTQNNLGATLRNQGTRTDGADGTRLLAEAARAYTQALTIRTKADHPVDWAMTQNNLAVALQNQGTSTDGAEGTHLLAKAVEAYAQALTVYTKADHPVQWAITQENIALTQKEIADHDVTTDPRPHLEAALEHVEAALTVFDPDHMSYNFEKATHLRDRLKSRLAELS